MHTGAIGVLGEQATHHLLWTLRNKSLQRSGLPDTPTKLPVYLGSLILTPPHASRSAAVFRAGQGMNREGTPGKSPEEMYIQQKVRVLLMLRKMGSNVSACSSRL